MDYVTTLYNILSRTEYAYTTGTLGTPTDTVTYKYEGAGDVLTEYDGTVIENFPLGIYRCDGWTYTIDYGNRLVRMSKWDYDANCEVARTFTYDANGMRTQRVEPDGTTYKYIYNGGLLSQMTVGSNTLYFTYDANGVPVSVILNGTAYYYVTNLQGDVVAIVDSHGGTVAKYVYDAWGNILDSSFFFRKKDPVTGNYEYNEDTSANAIGRLNPLRYRGYVYDTETGWYYLQSRFYNPEWGRFITADSVDYLGADGTVASYNLFSYCSNNPVMYQDPTGHSVTAIALSILAIAGLVTTSVGVATDNNVVTAIGLTMVAVPAIISGSMAVSLLTPVGIAVGSTTVLAGAGTAIFASAEYQEAITGNNWMLDAGMSEGMYNGLMLTTATIATMGTMASGVTSSFKINRITEFGKLNGSNYKGIKFIQKHNGGNRYMSLEFHHGHIHKGHNLHWQLNKWSKSGVALQKGVAWWTVWLKGIF